MPPLTLQPLEHRESPALFRFTFEDESLQAPVLEAAEAVAKWIAPQPAPLPVQIRSAPLTGAVALSGVQFSNGRSVGGTIIFHDDRYYPLPSIARHELLHILGATGHTSYPGATLESPSRLQPSRLTPPDVGLLRDALGAEAVWPFFPGTVVDTGETLVALQGRLLRVLDGPDLTPLSPAADATPTIRAQPPAAGPLLHVSSPGASVAIHL